MTNPAAETPTFEEWAEKTGNRSVHHYADLRDCWDASKRAERERIAKECERRSRSDAGSDFYVSKALLALRKWILGEPATSEDRP